MSASAVVLVGGSSEVILAADGNRDCYVLQLEVLETVWLAFGEDAAEEVGIGLSFLGGSVEVRGAKARLACNGYAAGASGIGIETHEGLTYRPGAFIG